jgi:catechol 2,3-dioxygenase-like lactoylglutathione lyase family enzyme
MTSLYFYDPDGNCVEIASAAEGRGADEPTLAGVFEVVFEVEDLSAAEEFYVDLGFEVVNRGEKRKRTRLTGGQLDVELWEPHLGLADARGGVHVDAGFAVEDPGAAADAVADRATKRESVADGVRIRDPDGHYLTLVS